MPVIYLIRHSQPSETSPDQSDPELSALGHDQARVLAATLDRRIKQPLPMLTSPLRRCRETIAPLAARWGVRAVLEPRLREVPSPNMASRRSWLSQLIRSTWDEADAQAESKQPCFAATLRAWRAGVLEAVLSQKEDSIMCTHFMVLNVVVGKALARGSVAAFQPANASITVVEVQGLAPRVIELGEEMPSRVI